MSMLLMVKAMQCKVGNATRKLVLLKLADHANDMGVCFPSYQYIADQCEMGRRTVIEHINALVKAGFVKKKERKTPDGQVSNLYLLCLDHGGAENALPQCEKCTTPVQDLHHPPVQNLHPEPVTSFNQSINHKKSTQKKSHTALDLLSDFGIDEDLAKDFIEHRKAKKAPITATVMKRLKREADKANISLADALETMMMQGWIGFRAEWLQTSSKTKPSRQIADPWTGFNKVNYYEGVNPDGTF